jgi:hypothetical protein
MKILSPLSYSLLILAQTCMISPTNASSGHSHAANPLASEQPASSLNGGRIVQQASVHFEFFLRPDSLAQITFLDANQQVIPVQQQSVSLVGGNRLDPVRINFVAQAGHLLSERPLPLMRRMPVVLQIQNTPQSEKVYEKFYLDLSNCSSCDFQEYACICGH